MMPRTGRPGITRRKRKRSIAHALPPITLALLWCAFPARADGPSDSLATEELLAPAAPTCPLDLEGQHRIEFRGKSWIVGAPEGDRAYTEVRFPATISPDGKRLAVGVRRDAWYLLLDGREIGPYDDLSAPIFSADGRRLAYFAKRGRRWFAVLDGAEQSNLAGNFAPVWIADKIAFSPDGQRVAYVGFTDNNRGHLVVDGKAWPECQDWQSHPIRFSHDSRHVAVACRLPGTFSETAVFLDGEEVARFNAVARYEFRPGSSELAIFGIGRGTVDGLFVLGLGPTPRIEPGREFTRRLGPDGADSLHVAGPYFSQDGAHVAYALSDDRQVDLYVDGRSVYYRKGSLSLSSLALSADGTRLLALLQEGRRAWIVDTRLGADTAQGWTALESRESEALSGEELFLSPSGRHFTYVANHAALRAAESWQAVVLDGHPGSRYTSICLKLFPRWNADESVVYVAVRAGAQYRVTQRAAGESPR